MNQCKNNPLPEAKKSPLRQHALMEPHGQPQRLPRGLASTHGALRCAETHRPSTQICQPRRGAGGLERHSQLPSKYKSNPLHQHQQAKQALAQGFQTLFTNTVTHSNKKDLSFDFLTGLTCTTSGIRRKIWL